MPLSKSTLADELLNCFKEMKKGDKDERYFADGVAEAIKTYMDGGDVSTTYSGAVPIGPIVSGTGTGNPSVTPPLMANPVFAATEAMKGKGGNSLLSTALQNGVQLMGAGPGTINQTVTGMAQVGWSPVPFVGNSTGMMIPVFVGLSQALDAVFLNMGRMARDGDHDKVMADGMADAIHGLFMGTPVTDMGTGGAAGAVGTGNVA